MRGETSVNQIRYKRDKLRIRIGMICIAQNAWENAKNKKISVSIKVEIMKNLLACFVILLHG